MKIPFEKFMIKKCGENDLAEILRLQDEAIAGLPSPDILRHNTIEMLTECLNAPHYTVGAWYEGELAGFSVLYYPHDKAEDLSLYLEGVEINGLKAANNKLCIVRKEYRGNELQYRLGMLLEKHARETGTELLCVTVSPKNTPSINNVLRMGFVYNRTLEKYGFERNLYYMYLR